MHSKNIDKCGKNPQSACRKPSYHTKCGKNCHKIISVCSISQIVALRMYMHNYIHPHVVISSSSSTCQPVRIPSMISDGKQHCQSRTNERVMVRVKLRGINVRACRYTQPPSNRESQVSNTPTTEHHALSRCFYM